MVYQQLRDEILNGRISPRERLTEPKLGKLYDVSRTPVREALSRLLSDGLVERTDFGYAVVVPSLEDLRNLYELRITLKSCAASPGPSRTRRSGTTKSS